MITLTILDKIKINLCDKLQNLFGNKILKKKLRINFSMKVKKKM